MLYRRCEDYTKHKYIFGQYAEFLLLKCGMCNYHQAMKGETLFEWCLCLGSEIKLGWNVPVSWRFNSQMVGKRSTALRKTMSVDPILPAPPRPHLIVTHP
jgi:hypothetical protein